MEGLAVKNLTVSYHNKMVLENVSLEFEPGRITALIGKNGSGKSTLLKAILGIVSKKEGQTILDGEIIQNYKAKELAKKVSYLPQIHNNNLDLDVKTIVGLGQYPYQSFFKASKNLEKLIMEALLKFNLTALADKPYNQLSGGEAQRVWLAMLYCQQPKYILLDEPTTFLDIGYQIELLDYLKDLAINKNIGIIIVIHDLNMASKYADYIYILADKKVKYQGVPQEVIKPQALKEIFGFDGNLVCQNDRYYILP